MIKKHRGTHVSRLLLICMCFILISQGCKSKVEQRERIETERPKEAEFVERKLCIQCHDKQYSEWIGSHHDLAMDVATEETVVGDFNNTTHTAHGVTSTFYRKDGKFFVRTDGRDGELHDYEITYVFGVDPLQQYMIEFPDGRIQLPDIGWDDHPKEKGGQRWVHLHPEEDITPRHMFHWTRRFLNWNYMCGECHTTNFQKNFDLETNTFKTTWTMIDVGCQACHGPGSNHVAWAKSKKHSDKKELAYDNMGLEVDLKAQDSAMQLEACARCHSRRNGLRKDYQYGQPFMDYYVPQVLTDPLYYPDGQILDEVYVYGSFIQSRKYLQGVRCTDCHHPHTARLHTNGNALCVSCHRSLPPKEYTNLKDQDYEAPEHHFHKKNSPGAQCVECHMPETKYMIVDPRRDHKFQIPRPDLSVKLKIPNPCNRCHQDKSAQWAASKVDAWYPLSKEKRMAEKHFVEFFAAGQAGDLEAVPGLINVAKDPAQLPIIQATALNILSRSPSQQALDTIASSLKHEDPLVRYEAVNGISVMLPGSLGPAYQRKKLSLLAPQLKDPIRAVRSEAARSLTDVPEKLFDSAQKENFEKALEEYKARQQSIADRPEAHLNLGLMYQNLGKHALAEASYKDAIRLVPDFIPVRFNLAHLYNGMGRNDEARQMFKEIIELEPGNGDAHYSLGLLLAEMNQLEEARHALMRAVDLLPDRARVRYNYALTLRHLGRSQEAEQAMHKAYSIGPKDPAIVHAITVFYMQEQQWEKALAYAEKLVALAPDAPGPHQLIQLIERELGANGGRGEQSIQ